MTLQHPKKILFLIAAILFVTGIYQKPAHAHRLNVFCYTEEGKVLVESYFQSGTFCEGCKIQVMTNGVQLFGGKTDAEGQYSFGFKQNTTYKVIVDAGLGHRGETVFKTGKVLGKISAAKKTVTNQQQHVHTESTDKLHEHITKCLSENEIEELVNAQVNQKIEKLKNDILKDQMKKGVKASDVIAGLGFIFGLCAIILVTFRKKDKA